MGLYIAKQPILHNGQEFWPGMEIGLSEEEAAPLLALAALETPPEGLPSLEPEKPKKPR